MEARIIRAAGPLRGEVRVPPDKSISHRAVLFAAMAEGESELVDVLDSEDVRSTIAAAQTLGARVEVLVRDERGLRLRVGGWGAQGPTAPRSAIDCGNSGTTARLLMGVLAGWPISATLTGDASLSVRPMRRVAEPLALMGARIELSRSGTMPVRLTGGDLRGIAYPSPVASAQVKSAVLLAGLRAAGPTSVTEPAASRDHTERMLPAFGVAVASDPAARTATVQGPAALRPCSVSVPADPSSAASLIAAALLVPGSDLRLPDVGVNPTRIAFVEALRRMGAQIEFQHSATVGGEPVATIVVRHPASLVGTTIGADEVPSLVDEVPVLAVVATRAEGITRFEGVGELRVKESDRLEATRAALEAFGARVRAGEDWLEVSGPTALHGARVTSLGDHRLAMAWTVAGLCADGTTTVGDFEAVNVSYPRFADDLRSLGAAVETA